jgi:hypothetical protein
MRKGSITIYLSLAFLCILLLISVITESARVNVVQTECKSVTYMAVDSVLAGYARQVYEDYGILLVWEKNSLTEQLNKYIQANIKMADLSIDGTNIMTTDVREIKTERQQYIVDNGGESFLNQINSYMKYAVASNALEKVVSLYNQDTTTKEDNSTSKDMINVNENGDGEIQKLVDSINEEISNIKETENIAKQLNKKSKRNKFLKQIKAAIKHIEEYKEKRADFLTQNKMSKEKDYLDENLSVLEQIKNSIEKEELIDSNNKESWEVVGEAIEKTVEKLVVKSSTKEDEENKSLYENAKELLEKGILSLVIDDASNVSAKAIGDSNLPSKKESKLDSVYNSIKNKGMVALYAKNKLGCYTNNKSQSTLSYELEYIISGEKNDRTNLTKTLEKMVAYRNVITLAYLVTDSEKMTYITTVASSATMAIGLPFLEPVVKGVLTEAWAMAEAINDVKTLVENKKISIIKSKSEWKTSLKNLLGNESSETDKKASINYQQFCMILIMNNRLNQSLYRIMDIININIQNQYNQSFDISKCFCGINVEVKYEIAPLFSAMPWALGNFGNNAGYQFSIKSKKEL